MADRPGAQELVDLPVKRRIAKDQAEGKHPARFAHCVTNGEAVVQIRGERLLAEDMLARTQRRHRVFAVLSVPRTDRHPLHARIGQQVLIAFMQPEIVAVVLPRRGDGVGMRVADRDDTDILLLLEQPANPRSAADDSDGGGFLHDADF